MSQLAAGQNPAFHDTVPALTTASVAHPDTWNPIHQALLENDVVVKAAVDALGNTLDQLDNRLDGVEATSSVALDRAMRLNWLYGSARMSLELFTDAWSLRDLPPVAINSAVAGDDSIDLTSTAGVVVGQEYVLFAVGARETVKIAQVLTANRVRINGVLANTYGAGAKLARTNWQIDVGQATAADSAVYFSKAINLSSMLGNHLLVIRRTASPAQMRVYYTDANHAAWTECPLVQQVATGVTDADMADYLYNVPATGDFRLKLVVTGGAINLKHLAAVTGKATTLGGYGIGDAYTKPEVDAAIAAVPKTRVVTLPTITGPSSVTPGTNFTLTAASTARLSGATVASFDFTKPDNTKQNVAATSGSASLTMQVLGSVGDTRNVLIEAIDSEGNRSAVKTHTLTITSNNAPSMAGFTHTVPASVNQATTATIQFSGATDADSDPVTYSIDAGTSGLTFSKAIGIAANESVTMTVPGSVLPSKAVSFTVYAVDNKGAQTPVVINLNILGVSQWELSTVGTFSFVPPVDGTYEVIVIGAGASGLARHSSGYSGGAGGAGGLACGNYALSKSNSYSVVVGQGGADIGINVDSVTAGNPGGSSSFGTLLSATGGYAGQWGYNNTGRNGNAGKGGQGTGGNIANRKGGDGGWNVTSDNGPQGGGAPQLDRDGTDGSNVTSDAPAGGEGTALDGVSNTAKSVQDGKFPGGGGSSINYASGTARPNKSGRGAHGYVRVKYIGG